jgi:hypothetical protein
MLLTVTNLSASITLNDLDVYQGYVSASMPTVNATGGARKYPLPYPFGHVVLGPSGNKQLPAHTMDMLKGGPAPMWSTFNPGTEWNQLIQAGVVSVTIATEATTTNLLDLMVASV